jgi:iron complex outermembrane recepter protein
VDLSPGSRYEEQLKTTRQGKIFTAYDPDGVVYDYDVTFFGVSPYLHAETSPVERLRLVAGLRYDRMEYDYRNHLGELQAGRHRRPADATPGYSHLSPKFGAAYELSPAASVFASYGHGFRAPSEGQLFRQGQTLNTLGLDPVTVDSYEAGIRGTVAGRVNYDVAVYTMTKTNDILTYTNPDGTRETLNAGETLHEGVEVGVGAAVTREVRLDLGYSHARHTYGQWQPHAGIDLGGNEMETAPRQIANAVFSYSPARLHGSRFAAEWTHVGRYWMDAENTHRYPGHSLVNLRASAPVYAGVGVFARLINATDRRFAESASYTLARGEEFAPGMPRTIYLGLQWN